MLPDATLPLPASLASLLAVSGPLFTAPSFRTFCGLACGFLAQAGKRSVCGMLTGAGLPRLWPHDRAHSFFSRARWSPDDLGLAVARLVAGLLVSAGQPVIRTMTFSVTCVCLGWGGTFALLVVYASRALHLTHVDVRLGLLYSAGELGGLLAAAAVPTLIKRLPIGPMATAFLAANAAALAFLALAPSYGWALLAFFLDELTYLVVLTTGITLRQMLTPDHLQSRVNTAGRMLAGAGLSRFRRRQRRTRREIAGLPGHQITPATLLTRTGPLNRSRNERRISS